MKAKLAMYKGNGTIYDKLVKWWTKSEYSHCELVVDGIWYTSSPRDGGVRGKVMIATENWDLFDVVIDEQRFIDVIGEYEDAKYDWLGIALTQVLPFDIHAKKRLFCSEFVAEVMGYHRPHEWTPQDIYEKMV